MYSSVYYTKELNEHNSYLDVTSVCVETFNI